MHKSGCKRSALSELVDEFSVSFRLKSTESSGPSEARKVACDVELVGQHYSMGRHVNGGCPHCLKVLLVLLELHDRMLSGQGDPSVERIGAQCEKVIHYASTSRDWPEVVLDVKIVRWPTPLHLLPEHSVAALTDKVRTELLNLGCREIPFIYLPPEPMPDRGLLLVQRVV